MQRSGTSREFSAKTQGIYIIMYINQRAFTQDSLGGLDLKDLIFPGVFEERCKTHR
jgi:hypothetical protein